MATRKAPATKAVDQERKERLTGLAEDCVRLMVQAIGGLPKPTANAPIPVRAMVQQLRQMYDEIDNPTAGMTGTKKGTVILGPDLGDDYDDPDEEGF